MKYKTFHFYIISGAGAYLPWLSLSIEIDDLDRAFVCACLAINALGIIHPCDVVFHMDSINRTYSLTYAAGDASCRTDFSHFSAFVF